MPYKNIEDKRRNGKEWEIANPDKVKAKGARWYLNNKDKVRRQSMQWHKENPLAWKKSYIKKHYGLTWEDYQEMIDSSDGSCSICGKQFDFDTKHEPCIDHCHETGAVRGLLCFRCNVALGGFNDNLDLLLKAAEYLRRN